MIIPFNSIINGIAVEFLPMSLVGKNYQVWYLMDGAKNRFHLQRDTEKGTYRITDPEKCPAQLVNNAAEMSDMIYSQQAS